MPRILIVDDDDQFRTMLRKTLQRAGYEVSEAVNGIQAIRVFHEDPADLVITDMLMPVMSGSRLISTLRADFPKLKIIALSGGGSLYRSASYLDFALNLGARKVLEKPLSRTELLKVIGDMLE